MPSQCERDENNWRIPRKGTRSRKIYDHTKAGLSPQQIVQKIGGSVSSIRVLKFRFRHWKKVNKWNREAQRKSNI